MSLIFSSSGPLVSGEEEDNEGHLTVIVFARLAFVRWFDKNISKGVSEKIYYSVFKKREQLASNLI